ncbi:MAG: hypothetical protein LBE38_02345 [Deltaproteobacteria bacterium]|jgi:hypothetical protein|nr:hypothetical protein [Deltaproteobacteria bacterium]
MKAAIILICSLFLLTLSVSAFALPDEQIQEMVRRSPDFSRAENRIVTIWDQLTRQQRATLRDEQVEWITVHRDQEANALMRAGYSKIEAYTIVTDKRSDYLLRVTGQSK